MKIFLFAVAGILATGTVNAWTYTYKTLVANESVPGEMCSSDGKRIVWCDCGSIKPSNPRGANETCANNTTLYSSAGCRLQDAGGIVAFCMSNTETSSEACDYHCGCRKPEEWVSVSAHRVSLTDETLISKSKYWCGHGGITTRWGCEADYFTTATIPSESMTCVNCPFTGKSAIGNTAITGCYVPANTPLRDSTGTYKYTSDCHYSK